MDEKNRRQLLRAGAVSASTLAVPSVVSAKNNRGKKKGKTKGEKKGKNKGRKEKQDGIEIIDNSTIRESATNKVVAMQLKPQNKNAEGEVVSRLYKVNKEQGSVSSVPVDQQRYDSLAGDGELSTQSTGEVVTADVDPDRLIERSDTYGYNLDRCDKHSYTHQYEAITAEFHEDLDKVGWTAAAGALATLASSALLTGGILAAGGVLAIITDTDTITFGVGEGDKTIFGYTQTFYQSLAGAGWKTDLDDLYEVSWSTGHPGR